jgi:GNAT superfamily N-acetyltransferase
MAKLLTLIRPDVPAPAVAVPAGYQLRASTPDDIGQLARLYLHSYDPGEACADLLEAEADIRAAFAGHYGQLWPAASLVATTGKQQIIAAVQIVHRAPWPDTPDCPFIIELFTARSHRRHGLARCLILGALRVMALTRPRPLALRVAETNDPALTLYRNLGFQGWNPTGPPDSAR